MASELSYALSNDDIAQLMKGKCKILRYSDISTYTDIESLLKPYGRVFILYESKRNRGHWVLLHKIGRKNLELFDSYGVFPDQQLQYISDEFRKQSNQFRKHLSHLLVQSKYTIHYNDKQLQELRQGVSTCGRWCIARAINNHLDIDEFNKAVFENCTKKNITPDQLVCELVQL